MAEKNNLTLNRNISKLIRLTKTNKILFETPITTSLRLESRNLLEVFLEWSHKILDIFPNKNLQHKTSSFLEKNLCHFKNSNIEFDRTILINTCHSGGCWRNIRSDEIELSDSERIKINPNFLELKNTFLQKMNIRKAEIWIDFLDIYTNHLPFLSDNFRNHLKKTSWCTGNIQNIHRRLYEIIFLLYFDKFECASCPISKFFCFVEIGIVDDKWFWHGCKVKNFDFSGKTAKILYQFSS